MVKFRTTRYDEGSISDTVLKFPNKVPIWRFRTNNPQRAHLEKGDLKWPNQLNGKCAKSSLEKLPDGVTKTGIYNGGFMMNEYTAENAQCWRFANELLSMGVVSETSAQYYWHDGMNHGMSFKFIPCKEF